MTSGSNGTCPTTQWCTARTGWDGPTGLGTPNGAGAFLSERADPAAIGVRPFWVVLG